MFGQLFREADSENIGVVTGEVAVTFFEKTRLDPQVLGVVSSYTERPRHSIDGWRNHALNGYAKCCYPRYGTSPTKKTEDCLRLPASASY